MGKPKKGKAAKGGGGGGSKGSKKSQKSSESAAPSTSDAGGAGTSSSSARPAVPGLVNLGNTCFFNSALQVLASAPLVRDHYGAPGAAGAGGPLGRAFAAAVAALSGPGTGGGKGVGTYNPSPLLAAVCKVAPQFKGRQQQDAHELLRFLLDGVRAEEEKAAGLGGKASSASGRKGGAPTPPPPDPAASPSFAERVFGGQLASAVACGCGSASTTLEPFMDLSLPVPHDAPPCAGEDAPTPSLVLRPPKKQQQQADRGPPPPLTSKQAKRAAKAAAQAAKAKAAKEGAASAEGAAAAPAPPPPPPELQVVGPPGAVPPPPDATSPVANGGLDEPRESFASELGEDVTSPTHSARGGDGLPATSGDGGAATTGSAPFHTPPSALADSASGGVGGGASPASGSAATDDISRLYGAGGGGAGGEPSAVPAAAPASDAGGDAGSSSDDDGDGDEDDGPAAGMAGLCSLFDSAANIKDDGAGSGDSQPTTPTLAAPPAAGKKAGGLFGSLPLFGGLGGAVVDVDAAPGTDLVSCLAAFFAPEPVEWECPVAAKERAAAGGGGEGGGARASEGERDGASPSSPASSAGSYGTPAAGVVAHGLPPASPEPDGAQTTPRPPPTRPSMRRSVSFCEAGPRVKLIPGSAEQRGTNFAAALRGDDHFVRPLRFGGACLMVTAHIDGGAVDGQSAPCAPWDAAARDKLHVEVHRQDDEPASLAALPASLAIASVDIDSVDDSDDEVEQARVRGAAQALMDCVADAVHATGSVGGMQRMVADGLTLAKADGGWRVKGTTPGEGPWVYPAAPQPSAGASPDVLPGTSPPVGTPPGAVAIGGAGATPAPSAAATGETSPRSEALSHFAGPGSPPVGGWMDKVLSKANGAGAAADASAASSTTKAAVAAGPPPPPPPPPPPRPPAPSLHAASHKRYCLHRAPPLLTLHLKRFERDARGRLRKLNGHVAFPLTLDGAATLPQVEGGGGAAAAAAAKGGGADVAPPPLPPAGPPPTYDLVGVVEHLGSMRGGHYVAYVRRDGGGRAPRRGARGDDAPPAPPTAWYRASDTHVSAVSVKDVLACEAYLLLYCRREADEV